MIIFSFYRSNFVCLTEAHRWKYTHAFHIQLCQAIFYTLFELIMWWFAPKIIIKQINNHFAIAIGFWPGWHTFQTEPFYNVLLANHPNYGILLYQPHCTSYGGLSQCLLCGFYTVQYDTIWLYSTTLYVVIALVLSTTFRSYGIIFCMAALRTQTQKRTFCNAIHNVCTIHFGDPCAKIKSIWYKQNFCYYHFQYMQTKPPREKEEKFSNDEFVCAVTFPNVWHISFSHSLGSK